MYNGHVVDVCCVHISIHTYMCIVCIYLVFVSFVEYPSIVARPRSCSYVCTSIERNISGIMYVRCQQVVKNSI